MNSESNIRRFHSFCKFNNVLKRYRLLMESINRKQNLVDAAFDNLPCNTVYSPGIPAEKPVCYELSLRNIHFPCGFMNFTNGFGAKQRLAAESHNGFDFIFSGYSAHRIRRRIFINISRIPAFTLGTMFASARTSHCNNKLYAVQIFQIFIHLFHRF